MWLSHTQTWGTGLHEWSVTRREDYGCSVAELSSEGYSEGGITTPPLTFFGRLCHTFCGILVPRPENEPGHPGLEIQSPNPWTTREFLLLLLLSICLCEWLGTELQLWALPWHSLGTGLWGIHSMWMAALFRLCVKAQNLTSGDTQALEMGNHYWKNQPLKL